MSTIYSRDSLDRYGDDLIELILSYIQFEDCFHFRCVSKQFNRLLFNKQNKLKNYIVCGFNRFRKSKINFIIKSNNIYLFRSNQISMPSI